MISMAVPKFVPSAHFHTVKTIVALLFWFCAISGQLLQSPCPNIFTYQLDPTSQQIYGYIEIPNLRVGSVAKVDVELSIAAQVAANNFGSLALIKTREETGKDIQKGLPAQYKIVFPRKDIIPTVKSISVNGKSVCNGTRAQGRVLTAIRLAHVLKTKLKSPSSVETLRVIDRSTKVKPAVKQFDLLPKVQQMHAPLPFNNDICGKKIVNFTIPLSTNGKRASKGQFPWIAPIFIANLVRGEKPIYICASTIITANHVLTAGHCVFLADELIKPHRLLVAAGMHNIDNFFDEDAVFSRVQSVIPHPNYVESDVQNEADVAVLKLAKTLPYTPFIVPICLWKGDDNLDRAVNLVGVVAGWGLTEQGTSGSPRFFQARIVSRGQCSAVTRRALNNKVFCADGMGANPCTGDSGSGMVVWQGDRYYLRGLVSKGQVDGSTLQCNIRSYGIYTDIAPYRFWLRTIIG
ncbi:serine protease gd [Culex quinquefasciatus]|uniref:serine protease gd n=1 Tax=Culex quinquefasciatus TaxID=7176 RepID=UPI0018E31286|nr:serine protease gd [Culex quinquefasciatus]